MPRKTAKQAKQAEENQMTRTPTQSAGTAMALAPYSLSKQEQRFVYRQITGMLHGLRILNQFVDATAASNNLPTATGSWALGPDLTTLIPPVKAR